MKRFCLRRRNTFTDGEGEVYVGQPVLPTGEAEKKPSWFRPIGEILMRLYVAALVALLVSMIVAAIYVFLQSNGWLA